MRFGGLVAINDLNFVAAEREITAIIGPNGAGKTTVFNCLTGFYRPTVGAAHLPRQERPGAARADRRFPDPARRPGADVPEHPPVRQHEHARESDRGPAQPADEGLRLQRAWPARASAPTVLPSARRSSSPSSGSTGPGLTPRADWNAGSCPTATSASSRSRAPCAPSPSSCASTSRPPASTRARPPTSPSSC